MAVLLGGKVRQVTIDPDNDDGPDRYGDTQIQWRRKRMDDREFARVVVQTCLAGPVAEMIYSGDPWHPGMVPEWAADWRAAWKAAAPLYAVERQRLEYLENISIQLYHRLRDDNVWMILAALADELLAHETLESEQIEEILEQLM